MLPSGEFGVVREELLNLENEDMGDDTDMTLPVRFNAFKHHRNFALSMVNGLSPGKIADLLDPVCNNYIDIYTGQMSPAEICRAVIAVLESMRVLQIDEFSRWIALSKGYRRCILPDGSEWVVRKSMDARRYIHLHPARTGTLTMRFKGSTLKTVYLLRAGHGAAREEFPVDIVNQARVLAGLSPVKRLEQGRGILNCWEWFFGKGGI